MSRRETLAGAAKLIAGLGIGAQMMATIGADAALAQRVRDIAGRAGKPDYGPLGASSPSAFALIRNYSG